MTHSEIRSTIHSSRSLYVSMDFLIHDVIGLDMIILSEGVNEHQLFEVAVAGATEENIILFLCSVGWGIESRESSPIERKRTDTRILLGSIVR